MNIEILVMNDIQSDPYVELWFTGTTKMVCGWGRKGEGCKIFVVTSIQKQGERGNKLPGVTPILTYVQNFPVDFHHPRFPA